MGEGVLSFWFVSTKFLRVVTENFMRIIRVYKAILIAFAFLFAQNLLLIHATKFGDEFHTHKSITCTLSISCHVSDQGLISVVAIIPPAPLYFLFNFAFAQINRSFGVAILSLIRGPPQPFKFYTR